MRIFLVLICSLVLPSLALGAQGEKKKEQPKKKQAQSAQHAAAPGGGPQKAKGSQKVATPGGHRAAVTQPSSVTQKTAGGHSAGTGAQKTKKIKGAQQVTTAGGRSATAAGAGAKKTKGSQQIAAQGGQTAGGAAGVQKTKKSKKSAQQVTTSSGQIGARGAGVQTKGAAASAAQAKGKPFKPQKFNLASKTKPNKAVAPAVTFQQNRRIQGSQNWQGSNYQVFRNYRSEWHDRDWWRHNHSRIVFVFGGPYYWNSGYWFPAWGYDPGAYYAYDGPIYGYNNLPPDQVIANVQAAMQQQGYYHGDVDGLLGPLTRAAVADYQRDHGLYITSAIDQPTLESLGMT
jgi:Putative peptidoglycan binding domain